MIPSGIPDKLKTQKSLHPYPIVACIDFDGTLYKTGKKIWRGVFYNRKTSAALAKNNVPLILVTGRATWSRFAKAEFRAFGMRKADCIITGAGVKIYYRDKNGTVTEDTTYAAKLKESTFTYVDALGGNNTMPWNKDRILELVRTSSVYRYFSKARDADSMFTLRFSVRNLSMTQLEQIKKNLESLFPHGVKVLIAEKLLLRNSINIYSGDILLVPSIAGKDGAIAYLLTTLSQAIKLPIEAYVFGDSSVDIGMLTMESKPSYYSLVQYGVSLTPRAYFHLKVAAEKNAHLSITRKEGPYIIYHVFSSMFGEQSLSPAQNSPMRKIITPFESLINKTVYPHLNADELSFKGLSLLIKGVNLIYASSPTKAKRMRGFRYVIIGNSLDLVDGIRARGTNTSNKNGQLVDVFCDRVKEFYQLYIRALKRFPYDEVKGYQTLLAAISCTLPSLARSQVEITGKFVPEQDEKNWSMFARTRKLMRSLFFDMRGREDMSYLIDQDIYTSNLTTYANRKIHVNHFTFSQYKEAKNSTVYQKKAIERFLLLCHLLEEEHQVVTNTLQPHSDMYNKYMRNFYPTIAPFLKNMHNTYKETPHFRLKNYLNAKNSL